MESCEGIIGWKGVLSVGASDDSRLFMIVQSIELAIEG